MQYRETKNKPLVSPGAVMITCCYSSESYAGITVSIALQYQLTVPSPSSKLQPLSFPSPSSKLQPLSLIQAQTAPPPLVQGFLQATKWFFI